MGKWDLCRQCQGQGIKRRGPRLQQNTGLVNIDMYKGRSKSCDAKLGEGWMAAIKDSTESSFHRFTVHLLPEMSLHGDSPTNKDPISDTNSICAVG